MAIEFPGGDPSAQQPSGMLTAHINAQFDALGKLPSREQADLAQQVANDFADRASHISINHSCYRRGANGQTGTYPTGGQIVEALLRDAGPAIARMPAKVRDLLRLDRQLLERYALRGRHMTAYAKRKSELAL
jgi:hypothetical protein